MSDLTVSISLRLDSSPRAGGRTAYALARIVAAFKALESDAIIDPPERRPITDDAGRQLGAVTVRHVARRGRFKKGIR